MVPLRRIATLVTVFLVALAGSAAGHDDARVPVPQRVGQVAGIRDVVARDGAAIVTSANGEYRLVSLPEGRFALAPVPPEPVTALPADLLPNSLVVAGGRDIRSAWLAQPTDRYAHGVFGDRREASVLKIETGSGEILSYSLSPQSVFEDRAPRLADIDGDGRDEILVVHSYLDRGAALALFGRRGGRLARLAESAPIGVAQRWLNPVGAGDFDGDGSVELAVVRTPHIGGILILYRWLGDALVEIARRAGVSNHAMGSTVLGMSAILDLDGDGADEILLPDQQHRTLFAFGFSDGTLAARWGIAHGERIVTSLALANVDGDGAPDVVYGLQDGSVMLLRR